MLAKLLINFLRFLAGIEDPLSWFILFICCCNYDLIDNENSNELMVEIYIKFIEEWYKPN